MSGTTFQVEGLKETTETLIAFAPKMAKRVLMRAVDEAGRIVLSAARARRLTFQANHKSSGHLQNSLLTVVRFYPNSGAVLVAVGPDKDYIGTRGDGRREVPKMIAHLVEFGHRMVARGRGRGTGAFVRGWTKRAKRGAGAELGFVPAYPFMGPALESTAQIALAAITERVKAGVVKECLEK